MSIEELDEKVVPIIEEISKDANVQTQKVQDQSGYFQVCNAGCFPREKN